MESTKLLEPGEVVVLCFDKIRDLKRVVEGKIYITNYRILFIEVKEGSDTRQSQRKPVQLGPLENEITNYYSVPIGYVGKYKFTIEKKEQHYLDLETKDKRVLKFRFDTAFSHQRASDAMSRHCEISKHRDLFTFDHSKTLREECANPNLLQTAFLNDRKVVDIVL